MKTVWQAMAVSAVVLLGTTHASATFIDFEGIGDQVSVTNQYAGLGVLFSATENGNPDVAWAASSQYLPIPPSTILWNGNPNSNRADVLSVQFTSGASGISFDWFPLGFGTNNFLNVYDTVGGLMGSYLLPEGPWETTAWGVYNVTGSGIGRLDFVQGNDGWAIAIDNLNFSASVPEPSALVLLGSALVGLAALRYRKA